LLGEPRRALQELETAAAVMPPTDAFELLRGDALLGLGREAEARAAWQRGLRFNPANAELARRLR
jgi:predicted negative regulator of RcsB-dependent stress response